MAAPVVYSFAKRYPEHTLTLLSRNVAAPIFEDFPQNVHFMGVDLNDYKGAAGLFRLFRQLKAQSYDVVADLHDVLRTKYLRTAFKITGTPTASIKKGRKEKKTLTGNKSKGLCPLMTSAQRYAATFAELGFPLEIDMDCRFPFLNRKLSDGMAKMVGAQGDNHWIGIAPFAAHKGKIYPLSLMKKVIATLSLDFKNRLFLFGAGAEETRWCEKCEETYPQVYSLAGHFNLAEELTLMSRLNVMVTMDSANMHLATLCHIPTVSIWGATHPYAGFVDEQKSQCKRIGLHMDCRPCSIYGEKTCARGDYACLWHIKPDMIVNAVKQIYNSK